MRAAAILGLGCSLKNLAPFQSDKKIEWRMGMPGSSDEADVVLLFGGDGTIHRHLGQLVRLGLPALVVPAGSGNDFARGLGLRRVRDSLAAWRRFCAGGGNVRSIDLGVIAPLEGAGGAPSAIALSKIPTSRAKTAREMGHPEFSSPVMGERSVDWSAPPSRWYFCCVAGVGLDGEVSARANRLPHWLRGHGGYVLSLAPTIFTFAALPMKILTRTEGDEDWTTRSDRPTLLAAFANTSTYGGGMKIAPQAKMDDGLLDVCIVGGVDPFKLFCMFPTIYSGRHLKTKEVEYFQSGRVRVETEHPLDVYADGEFVCRTPVEVGVERAALRVVVPRGE
jgi:diacylglycerol kinase (ATP)